ncbi:Os08g0374600 [Oryza sativa Japonica Group]|uniref:Os08g0374600 protein n=1 Tax=Oryza sativa subsp. japonica TaxID=39947 RepID=A0A0P0XF07_ORYSJ|nr:Os08g0374600 [Oryza sativa Japonica Group]
MATNNFAVDRQIGEGRSFGMMMYKGRLPDRREVAIRRASPRRKGDFLRELAILSPLRHDHIVRLLGCCVAAATTTSSAEDEDCLLVYEYIDNGTLYDHLHGSDGASSLAIHDEKHGAVVATSLVASVLPNMEAGDLMKELDRGPGLKPTPRQLKATEVVARTAVRCVHSQGKERPPMTEVVANLQEALDLLSLDE